MVDYSILIVEDDPELADIFNTILSNLGLKTEIARDGRRALKRLGETIPDLMLLDLNLPYVSGFEILKYVRADPRLTRLTVVVATANPHAIAQHQLDEQADLVLIKPMSFKQTYALFERLVQSKAIAQ